MAQNLRDQRWVLDAGDHSELATAFRASLDIDGEDPFEPLHPTHGCQGLVAIHRALRSLRHDAITMLKVLSIGLNMYLTKALFLVLS
jgi:hypothetical protein